MTKQEAIKIFVERNFSAIPQDWVKIVSNELGAEIYSWPMWSMMWIIDGNVGEQLLKHAKEVGENDDNEEMRGAMRIADTAAYIYELDGEHVLGINGAGWDFYDGVWDVLYDLVGLKWHE